MPQRSAGILLYRHGDEGLEVLVVHPGGPFFARRDAGAWSIPKGLYEPGEEPLACARREFAEELGSACPDGPALELGEIRQRNGKRVTAWAVQGDLDATAITSNSFELEWPPRSGHFQEFPEVDRAAWFTLDEARDKLIAAQAAFLDRLETEGTVPSVSNGDDA
jgi:predicted NUDIX family NTP pyrophosphohydrolase